jgi:phosphatidylinositol phospholipase C delta
VTKSTIDPYIEVSIHVPDWTHSPFLPPPAALGSTSTSATTYSPPANPTSSAGNPPSTGRALSYRTGVVKNNGFNPVWQENACLPFDCVGDMKDLIFVRFAVRTEGGDEDQPLAVYCSNLGSLQSGEFWEALPFSVIVLT